MQLANQEAQRFNHEYIGTEHILLGVVKEGSGVAANVLKNLEVDLRKIRLEVETRIQSGPDMLNKGKLPQTPRAKNVIQYAIEESQYLHHNYVGTEHILLGLLREDEGFATQVLMNLGLRLENVRAEILAILGPSLEKGGSRAYYPPPPIRWSEDETKGHVYHSDDETKNRARHLAEEIRTLQRAKEEAVASQDFDQAAQLRDRGHEKGRELSAISLPPWLRRNIEQAAGLTTAFKFPCLDTLNALHDNAGEPDAKVLSVLPNPLLPPVRFVVANIPHFSVSTLKAVLPLDDIGSPFFQALLPLISPESIARFKSGHEELVRSAFNEVERAADATRGRPLLLCVVRPTALSEDVQGELFTGIRRTDCQFVVFEELSAVQAVLGLLPPATKLLGV
jgi:hypothetical protein